MPSFRSYIDQDGTDVIQHWFNARSTTKQARAKFRNKLRNLSRLNRNEWRRPLFDTLGEECSGLSEIRFDANNVPWRPLGFFQEGKDDADSFILVLCASKDEYGWLPRNACALGLRRKAEILSGVARTHDLPIPF
jgi:Phage derived protein Gp49-like (DUF891)